MLNKYKTTSNQCAMQLFSIVVFSCQFACSGELPDTSTDFNNNISGPTSVNTTSILSLPEKSSSATTDMLIDDDYEVRLLSIAPYKVECEGFHLSQCWQITTSDNSDVTYVYEAIDGFDYQWGYQYELLVTVSKQPSLMSDTLQQRYDLVEIVHKSHYHHQQGFEYVARYANESIVKVASGKYQLAGGQTMVCETTACASIDSALTQGHSALLKINYSEQPGEALELAGVLCTDSRSAFKSTCMGRLQ